MRARSIASLVAAVLLAIVIDPGHVRTQTTIRKVYAGGTSASGDSTYTLAQFQDAINDAACGDTIKLQNSATFVGTVATNGFVLREKSCPENDTSYITITGGIDSTGADVAESSYPANNVRVVPAYAAVLPNIQPGANNAPAIRTVWPAETSTGCSIPCVATYWKLRRLEFVPFSPWNSGAMLVLGTNNAPDPDDITAGDNQDTVAEIPHHLIVDQVYMHGDPADGQHRAMTNAARITTVSNSYFSDIKSQTETQAISVVNTVGPQSYINNYIEATGENFMTGGSDPYGRFTATISGSPTVTSATLSTCTDLGTTANHRWFSIEIGGVEHFRMIDTINTTTCAITWAEALPGVPDVPGNVQWSWTLGGILFEKNHVYKPATLRDPIQAGPTGVTATPTTGGTLTAQTGNCYRVMSRQQTTGNQFAQSAESPEVCVTTTATNNAVNLSWTASANADEYRIWWRVGNTTRFLATVAAPTTSYSHLSPTAGTQVAGTPQNASVTAIAGGGTLAANTYDYRVMAMPNEQPASQVVTCTLAATGHCDLSWDPVVGATSYRIYGRHLPLLNVYLSTTGTTISDTGQTTTSSDIFSYDTPSMWIVKNTFELKNCDGLSDAGPCIVRGNVIDGSWMQAQTGMGVNIKTNNQNFNDDSAELRNTEISYNIIRNNTRGIQICAYDCDGHGSGRMEDITIRHNLIYGVGASWGTYQSWIYFGAGYNAGAPPNRGGQRFTFDHNTILGDFNGYGPALISSETTFIQWTDMKWTNNITRRGINGWHALHNGSFGGGGEGTTAWNNAVNGSNRLVSKNVWTGATCSAYPDTPNNFCPTETELQACFTNYAGNDFSLAAGCAWNNAGTDGTDIGADITTVNAYATIALSGDNSGAPPSMTVTTTTLPDATIGSPYSFALDATGGTTPYTWTVTTGTLPTGITLSSGGLLSGTPSGSAGTSTFTVRATGSLGLFDEQGLTLTTVASGGGGGGSNVPTRVGTAVTAGSSNASVLSTPAITISGTDKYLVCVFATQLQSRTGVSFVLDPTGTNQSMTMRESRDFDNAGLQSHVEYWDLVNPLPTTGNGIITATLNLSTAVAIGCQLFEHVDQTTPHGAFFETGASSNTVTVDVSSEAGKLVIDTASVRVGTVGLTEGAGQTNIVERQSASGAGNVTALMSSEAGAASVTMSWTVDDATAKSWTTIATALNGTAGGTPPPAVNLTTTVLPWAIQRQSYSFQLEATGGTTPYAFSRVSGDAFPAGITMNASGLISGTPTTTGVSTFTIRVTDAAAQTDDQELSLGRLSPRPVKINLNERNIYVGEDEPSLLNGRIAWEGDVWVQPSTNTMRVMASDGTWKAVGVGRGPQPTCDAKLRGTYWYTEGAVDAKDTVSVCAKDAGNVYAWRVIY